MKYIVKNCPAYVLMRTATSGTYFNICGNAKGHIKCCDIDDCNIKQIVGLCKENKFFNYGAVMLGNGLSADILDLLEIEKVNE